MAGLNTDPTADASYSSLDYAWYMTATGRSEIWINNQQTRIFDAYSTDTAYQIAYDGRYVVFLANGIEHHRVDHGPNALFYFDSSFGTPGGRLYDVDFSARGSDGLKGVDGINPPVVTVSATPQTLRYNSAGGYIGGPVTFTAVLTNAIGPVGWSEEVAGHGLYGRDDTTFSGNSMTISAARMQGIIDYNAANGLGAKATIAATASGTSHRVTVSRVDDGRDGKDSTVPGPAGVPALALTSSAPSLTFAADYLGGLKSGQLAQVIVLTFLEGATNVSSSVDWSVPEFSGCTGQMTSAGLITFNSVTSNGYVRVNGTYKGVTLPVNVPIVLSRDAPPANSDQQASIGTNGFTIGGNSYSSTPHVTITVSVPGGVLRGKMDVNYSAAGQGNVYLEGMLGYRLAGSNNAWSFLPAVQGTQARISNNNSQEPINDQGFFNSNQTVSVGAGRYEVGIFMRRYQGAQSAITDGRFQASNG